MMKQATCEVCGMDYKLWFWMIAHMLTTSIDLHIAYESSNSVKYTMNV